MAEHTQRNLGLDVIRCIALFSVIAVHFFLNAQIYDLTVSATPVSLYLYLRSALMISIPLFLMSSGYLLKNKKPTGAYYLRILRILFFYVAASLAFAFYRRVLVREELSWLDAFWGLFSFSTLSYSWYIEMYWGLFLLIPFLNILYGALESRKQKQWLIATLIFLTAAPGMVNIYRFTDWHWWLNPSSSQTYQNLIPEWWTGIYPLTYYFLGCYLREYPLQLPARRYWLLIPGCILLAGSYNLYRSWGSSFLWGPWQDWGSGFSLVLSVLVFSLCFQGSYRNLGKFPGKIISWVAELSLGAYLLSQLFDHWFYSILNSLVPEIPRRLIWFPVAVAVVLTLSVAGSYVLNVLYKNTLGRLVDRLQEKLTA